MNDCLQCTGLFKAKPYLIKLLWIENKLCAFIDQISGETVTMNHNKFFSKYNSVDSANGIWQAAPYVIKAKTVDSKWEFIDNFNDVRFMDDSNFRIHYMAVDKRARELLKNAI